MAKPRRHTKYMEKLLPSMNVKELQSAVKSMKKEAEKRIRNASTTQMEVNKQIETIQKVLEEKVDRRNMSNAKYRNYLLSQGVKLQKFLHTSTSTKTGTKRWAGNVKAAFYRATKIDISDFSYEEVRLLTRIIGEEKEILEGMPYDLSSDAVLERSLRVFMDNEIIDKQLTKDEIKNMLKDINERDYREYARSREFNKGMPFIA